MNVICNCNKEQIWTLIKMSIVLFKISILYSYIFLDIYIILHPAKQNNEDNLTTGKFYVKFLNKIQLF